MPILAVTYELMDTSKDYNGFFAAIRSYEHRCELSRHAYLIDTDDTALMLLDKLSGHLSTKDDIYIFSLDRRGDYCLYNGNPMVRGWIDSALLKEQ